jgi:hypothetical protein
VVAALLERPAVTLPEQLLELRNRTDDAALTISGLVGAR